MAHNGRRYAKFANEVSKFGWRSARPEPHSGVLSEGEPKAKVQRPQATEGSEELSLGVHPLLFFLNKEIRINSFNVVCFFYRNTNIIINH